jgi:hypothetical protein
MNDTASEFERLLAHAALKLWSDLPRDVQELLFENGGSHRSHNSKQVSDIPSRPSSTNGASV